MKRVLFFLGVLSCNSIYAQDIHFSQFYENAILRNPALTGIFTGDYKAGVNYRQQWTNFAVPFTTVLASVEGRTSINRDIPDFLSFGVTATYDRAGTINFNSFQIYGAVNYNKAIADSRNSYLSLGFAGGYIQRSIDITKATFSSQYIAGSYNPDNASGENITNIAIKNYDLSVGLSYNSSAGPDNMVTYYIGAAGYHVTKPKHVFNTTENLIRLNPKFTANLGARVRLDEQYAVTVHFNHLMQAPYQETLIGGLISWKTPPEYTRKPFTVYGGMFIRVKDAIIPTFKMDYRRYSLTVSYDINTSSLKAASNGAGGLEISLFTRGIFKKSDDPDYRVRCPRFEDMLPSGMEFDY